MVVRRGSVVLVVSALLASTLGAVGAPIAVAAPVASSASPADLPGGTYVGVAPARLLDTRTGVGAPVGPTTRTVLPVAGRGGVPTTGVAAVVLNVTVTGPGDAGWLAVSPTGTAATSNVNFARGQDVAQLATSKVDDTGRVVLTSSVRTHVVADVVGWFTDSSHAAAGATYTPASARRLFDSRVAGSGGPLLGGTARRVVLAGVPAGTTAVAVNLTSVLPDASVFVAAWTSGRWPGTSSMNVAARDIRSNRAIVPVAADGSIQVLVNLGRSDLVVDLSGWFTADDSGSRFVPLDPVRLGDSRTRTGGLSTNYELRHVLSIAGTTLPGQGIVLPPTGAVVRPTAAWLAVTVVSPVWAGWLAVSRGAGSNRPPPVTGTSDVNFAPGATPNAVLAGVGDGTVWTTASIDHRGAYDGPPADLVVDIAGLFVDTPPAVSGLTQQGPSDHLYHPAGAWNRPVDGDWGDVVELAGYSGVAVLRRDGTVLRRDALSGVVSQLTTNAVHIAATADGVFVVMRDGTVWTDVSRRGAHGVDASIRGFRPVKGATDVVAVKPVYLGGALVARRGDGSLITWGGEDDPVVRALTWAGTDAVDMSFSYGTNCVAHGDGSVEVVDSGRAAARTAPINARAVVSEGSWPIRCLALDADGRVHRLTLASGAVDDTVLDGPTATTLVTAQTEVATFTGRAVSQARVLTSEGSVYDLVSWPDTGTLTWLPVPGVHGATVIGGGFSLLTWVPPVR